MKRLLLLCVLLGLSAPAAAQCPGQLAPAVALGYEALTVSTTALQLHLGTGNLATAYSNGVDYVVGNMVSSGTTNYLCLAANGPSSTVKAVTDTAYWRVITVDPTKKPVVAYATLETADLRFLADGTTPTSAIGLYWDQSSQPALLICGEDSIRRIKFIRAGSSDGALKVQYYAAAQ
jgi:hypothetical protein